MDPQQLRNILEAALLTAGGPLSIDQLQRLFRGSEVAPGRQEIRKALSDLGKAYKNNAIELVEVATGFRVQIRRQLSPWLSRFWDDHKPPRYSRALLETLVIIAYRQPITRTEIEEIRGVSVSSQIVRTLQERGWIRIVGHREVPGRPALFATTRPFLDYFGLKSLDELPTIAELQDQDKIQPELGLGGSEVETGRVLMQRSETQRGSADDEITRNVVASTNTSHTDTSVEFGGEAALERAQ